MPVIMSKCELYNLYNILEISLFDYEDYEKNEDEYSEETVTMTKSTESVIAKIKAAHNGLEKGAEAPLKLSAEEALIVVERLDADIKEHEDAIGSEDDPVSYNAERAYHMNNLKERIQDHFRRKLGNLILRDGEAERD